MNAEIAEVIIDKIIPGIDKHFDYIVPNHLKKDIKIGQKVVIPFGRKHTEGYIIKLKDKTSISSNKLKDIKKITHYEPLLDGVRLELMYWIKDKYFCKYIDAIRSLIPPIYNKKKGIIYRMVESSEYQFSNTEELDLYLKIKENGGEILKGSLDKNECNIAEDLTEKGFLNKEEFDFTGNGTKKEKWIKKIPNIMVNYTKSQQRVMDILDNVNEIMLNELLERSNTSRYTINKLMDLGAIEVIERLYTFNTEGFSPLNIPTPTPYQQNMIKLVKDKISQNGQVLLHGDNGSGKTLIYFEVLKDYVAKGKKGLLMVPEISLTPQLLSRAKDFFGDKVAVYHSMLTPKERYIQWHKIKDGHVDIVIGARSAIFLPINPLGIIIIDEEHDDSYKQSEIQPKYCALEVAKKRCQLEGAVLLLGSATPSVDTYYKTIKKEIELVEMKERYDFIPQQLVEVIDMRKELKAGNKSVFSKRLLNSLNECLNSGKQALLFLNKKGYHTFVMCRDCGHTIFCPHCDVSLKYHGSPFRLSCNYCHYSRDNIGNCPSCGSSRIRFFGTGTERIEKEISLLFPDKRILRLDRDTVKNRKYLETVLENMEKGKGDILIGTQMISKGLDFPNVELVGVITADTMLNLPEYRSGEMTFQILYQVSGRAGRRVGLPGKVILQTYQPENYAIKAVASRSYDYFISNELDYRKRMMYPPYSDFISITFMGKNTNILQEKVVYGERLLKNKGISILGPTRPQVFKLKDYYRYRILIKNNIDNPLIGEVLNEIMNINQRSRVVVDIDINPKTII